MLLDSSTTLLILYYTVLRGSTIFGGDSSVIKASSLIRLDLSVGCSLEKEVCSLISSRGEWSFVGLLFLVKGLLGGFGGAPMLVF